MKKLKLTLLAFLLLFSEVTYAHGQEVLFPFFIQFVFLILLFVILAFIRLKIVGKLLLTAIYLLSAILICLLTSNIPYRDNKLILDTSLILVPIALTLGGYLILKKNFNK
jgi:hypothetical protein